MGSSTQFWLTEHKLHCFSTNTALQASPVTLPSTSSPTYQLAQVASTGTSVSYPLTGGNLFPSTPSTSFSSVVTNTSSPFWRADCIGTWLITTERLINPVYGAHWWSSGRKVTWERVHKVLPSSAVNSTFLLEISTLIPQPAGLVRGCHLSSHNSQSDFRYIEWAGGIRC